MPHDEPSSPFDLHTLSPRERAVLDLAIEGNIDERIAQGLGISVSTVNSYWVRIRGKLGQLSRTELVASVLRERHRLESASMAEEIARLSEEARLSDSDLVRAHSDLRAVGGVPWYLLTLDHAPCALMAVRSPGLVVYANREAEALLRAVPGTLEGRYAWEMAVPENRVRGERASRAWFAAGAQSRVVVGLDYPHLAQRDDGTSFRAVLVVEPFDAPEGRMACVSLREFLGDIEALLAEIRHPYVSSRM